MRIKTTYGQLKVGDRFFCSSHSPKGACRMKTTPRMFTQLVDEDEVYSSENWQDDEEVWIDAEEKIKQQATEIADLKICIEDARSLMEDYDGYETVKGLRELIDQVDDLLMTHKPMERKVE